MIPDGGQDRPSIATATQIPFGPRQPHLPAFGALLADDVQPRMIPAVGESGEVSMAATAWLFADETRGRGKQRLEHIGGPNAAGSVTLASKLKLQR